MLRLSCFVVDCGGRQIFTPQTFNFVLVSFFYRALGCRVVHNTVRARIIVASHDVQGDGRHRLMTVDERPSNVSIGVASIASTTVSEWLHNASTSPNHTSPFSDRYSYSCSHPVRFSRSAACSVFGHVGQCGP